MTGVWGLTIVLFCLLGTAQTGSLAEKLAQKTIAEFLAGLKSLPVTDANRVLAIDKVIEMARASDGNCIRKNEDSKCTWTVQRPLPASRRIRAAGLSTKAVTKSFISSFVRNLATKSFPTFKQQIFSVFSNDSSTFLPLASDTVKKLQVSANLILLGTIQKMEQAAAKLTDLKIPILTLSSILLILVLCLVGSCFAKQVDTIRQRKATRKQKEMDDYYNRRQMREQLNSTPAYEALQIE